MFGGKPARRRRPYFCLLQSANEYSSEPKPRLEGWRGAAARSRTRRGRRGASWIPLSPLRPRVFAELRGSRWGLFWRNVFLSWHLSGPPQKILQWRPMALRLPVPRPPSHVTLLHTCELRLCGSVKPPAASHPEPRRGAARGRRHYGCTGTQIQ